MHLDGPDPQFARQARCENSELPAANRPTPVPEAIQTRTFLVGRNPKMIKKHWTPQFVAARIGQIWFEKRNPGKPWFTRQAIALLEQLLQKNDKVLEFGSGRSTVFFATCCAHVLSVEHDDTWFAIVDRQLSGFSNVDYRLKSLHAQEGSLPEYVDFLNSIPDESFTILVNDGRLRGLVAKYAFDKVAPGGVVVVDNAERYLPNEFTVPSSRGFSAPENDWQEFYERTRSWRKIWTANGVTTTLLLFKPCG